MAPIPEMSANTMTICHHWPAASASGLRHSASLTAGKGNCRTVSTTVTTMTDMVAIGRRHELPFITC
jgi:hypothetical protein